MAVLAEQCIEPLNRMLGAHGHGDYKPPEVWLSGFRKTSLLWTKKTGQTTRYAADGNHAVILPNQVFSCYSDRLEPPHFVCAFPDHDENRSV